GRILGDSFKAFRDQQGGADPAVRALGALLPAVERLPARADPRVAEIERRQRGVRSVRKRLRGLLERFPEARRDLAGWLRTWEGEEHVDRLDALIAEQPWLLANWRAAPEEIDYRRFFDIADLVALRSQDDDVFHATHDLVIRLVRGGAVTGLRLDHVDGLWDP